MNGKATILSLILAAWCMITTPASIFAASQPQQTGQVTCYDSAGTPVSCAGTAQDGEIRAGIAWPGNRFVDNTDGTISDNLTGLMWLQNPSTSGAMSWQGALDFVKAQNAINPPLLNHGDWRLPNILELISLVNRETDLPRTYLDSVGFINVPATQFFWTSTTTMSIPAQADTIEFDTGLTISRSKSDSGFAWLVRGPTGTGAVQLPRTGQDLCFDTNGTTTNCAGTGQDGNLRIGQAWPSPRFTTNNQIITDNLTGLGWTKDANPMAQFDPGFDQDGLAGDGAVTWQHALEFISSLNALTYLGFQDWRLPNLGELASLANAGQSSPAIWLQTLGFTSIPQADDFPWSSTSYANGTGQALTLTFADGIQHNTPKGTIKFDLTSPGGFVWPVRGSYFGASVLTFSPANVDFGSVTMGATSAARSLVIRNTTTAFQNLIVNALTLEGSDFPLFSITPGGANPCASLTPTVAPGTNCSFDLTFAPDTTGVKTANIKLITNAGSTSVIIPLRGTAVDGEPPVGAISINSGAANTASINVTLSLQATDNSGNVAEMRFSNDGVAWAGWQTYNILAPWSLTPNDGLKTVYAQFRDAAGNISNTVSATINLRSVPPTDVTITGIPANGYTNATTLVLTVNGSDTVEYKYTLIAGDTGSAIIAPAPDTFVPIRTQIVMTDLPEGNYAIQVTGRDIAGNEQPTPSAINWIVDRTPPPLSITNGSAPSPTNTPNPTLTGTVEIGVQSIAIYLGSTLQGYASVLSNNWSYTLSTLGQGPNTVTVTASDNAGNSTSLQRIIVYDTQPPTATVTGTPAASATANSTSAILTVDGTDVTAYKYKLDTGAYSVETPVDTPIRLNSLADGSHTVSVIGRDLAGNYQAQATATNHTWRVDTIPPTFTLTAPISPTNAVSQNIVISSISEVGAVFTVKNETSGVSSTATSTAGNLTFSAFPLTAGTNQLTITGRDAAGNATAAGMVIEVDSTPPTATITASFNNGDTITTANSTFIVGGSGVSQYLYKLDKTNAPPVNGSYPTTAIDIATPITLTSLVDGNYTLSVLGRDLAGNTQTIATTISWILDSTAPTARFTTTPPTNTSSTSANFIIDTTTGVVAYKYAVDSGTYIGGNGINVNTTINLTGLTNGPHTLFIIGRDANGNWQTIPTSFTWTIQTTLPDITINPLSSPTKVTQLSGTVQKGSTVAISLLNKGTGTSTSGTATVSGSTWTYTMTLVSGVDYRVTATATSAAGTINSTSIDFVFDSTAPTVTITSVTTLPTIPTSTGSASAVFKVTANETIVSYTYRLDTGATSSAQQPDQLILLSGLTTGNHTLSVTATDLAGNTGTSTKTWAVDTTKVPTAVITSAPAAKTNASTASIIVEPSSASSYQYRFTPSAPPNLYEPIGTISAPGRLPTIIPNTAPAGTPIDVTTMPEGTYVLEVYGSIDGTNFQTYPTTTTWTVDRTPPVSVTISGIPTSGSTNATTLNLTASGTDLVAYRYLMLAAPTGYAVSPAQDTEIPLATQIVFNGTPSPLPAGTYSFAIIGKDSAGNWQVDPTLPGGWQNSSNATIVTFTVDRTEPKGTIPPDFNLLNPHTTPTNSINQTLTGTVDDLNARITIAASTAAVGGSISPNPDGTWSFDLKGLVKGPNIITITATDLAGNVGTTSATISLATDLPLAVVSGAPPSITSSTSATLTVTGANNVVNYTYDIDNGGYQPVAAIGIPIALTALGEGAHLVRVLGQDIAGNWQESPTLVRWTVDTVPPTVTVSPATPTSPTNAKSASFIIGGNEVVAYRYQLDGGTQTAETKVAVPIALNNLGNGSHTLSVIGKDQAGNWQVTPTDVTWIVQTTQPDLTIDSSVTESPVTAVSISPFGTVTPAVNVTISKVTVTNSTTGVTQNAILGIDTWSLATLNLTQGVNSILVTATDSAGNVTSKSFSITRINSPPTALVLNGAPPSQTNSREVSLTIGGTDVVAYQYQLQFNNGAAAYSVEIDVSQKLYFPNLLDGRYDLSVIGRDYAGNWQDTANATTRTWTVDTQPPSITIDKVTSPTRLTSQKITGTVEPGSSIKVLNASTGSSGNAIVAGTSWNITLVGLVAGDNSIVATATDAAGNTASVATIIEFDNTPPTAVISGTPAALTQATDATLNISGDHVVTYNYSVDNGPYSGDIPIGTPIALTALSDGTHTVLVLGKKQSGAVQLTPTQASWTVDTTPPTATISGVPPTATNQTDATLTIGGTGVVTYRYSFDGGPLSVEIPVANAIILANLAEGSHQVSVIGRDQVGNWQVVATVRSWTVDTTPPSLTLNPVIERTVINSQTIGGTVEAGATIAIVADTTATVGPISITGTNWRVLITNMTMGPNNFTITATDTAGNRSVITTLITLYTPPFTTISGVPTEPVNVRDFTFHISGQGVIAYKYSLDGANYSDEIAINTPLTLTGLTEGTHTILVIGRDASNIWQSPPTQASWVIDLTPPTDVTISGMPSSPTNQNSLSLVISGSDIDEYKYRLDGGAYSANVDVSTPLNLVGLSDGPHQLDILGEDQAGNVQQFPTTVLWVVDTVAPTTTATPTGGVHNGSVTVTLSTNEVATIYLTLDGSQPTIQSANYTAPIYIAADTILKYFAVDLAGNIETIKTQMYTFSANGDVNGDGKIDTLDVRRALEQVVGIPPLLTAAEFARADIAGGNGSLVTGPKPDGKVDSSDVLAILKIVVRMLKF